MLGSGYLRYGCAKIKVLFIITSKPTKSSRVASSLFQVIPAVGKLVSSVNAKVLVYLCNGLQGILRKHLCIPTLRVDQTNIDVTNAFLKFLSVPRD